MIKERKRERERDHIPTANWRGENVWFEFKRVVEV